MKTIRHCISFFSVGVLDGFTHQLADQAASLAVLFTLLIHLATRVTRGSALVARRRSCSSSSFSCCRRGSSRRLLLSVSTGLEMEHHFVRSL